MRRGQRNAARYTRRAATSWANELAAEQKNGVVHYYNPSDLSSPTWFHADEPPTAWLNKEQARRNNFGHKK